MKLLWGMCGSFCNHAAVIEQLTDMVQRWPVTMIVSENTAQLDTRFGMAKERLTQLERLTGKRWRPKLCFETRNRWCWASRPMISSAFPGRIFCV